MLLSRTFKLCNHLLRSSLPQIKPLVTLSPATSYHIFTKPRITSKCEGRTFYNWFRKPSEDEYKYKDKIAPQYDLIYNTSLDKYLVLGQVVSSIIGGILFIGAIITGDTTIITKEKETHQPQINDELLLFGTALIICIVIIQRMILKLPIRIYKSPITKEYVFVNRGVWPFSKKYYTCVANQLRKTESGSQMLPWNESTYKLVRGHEEKTLVLLEHCFKRPADLNILLGYQREDE